MISWRSGVAAGDPRCCAEPVIAGGAHRALIASNSPIPLHRGVGFFLSMKWPRLGIGCVAPVWCIGHGLAAHGMWHYWPTCGPRLMTERGCWPSRWHRGLFGRYAGSGCAGCVTSDDRYGSPPAELAVPDAGAPRVRRCAHCPTSRSLEARVQSLFMPQSGERPKCMRAGRAHVHRRKSAFAVAGRRGLPHIACQCP